jgi:hypothetical protein
MMTLTIGPKGNFVYQVLANLMARRCHMGSHGVRERQPRLGKGKQ